MKSYELKPWQHQHFVGHSDIESQFKTGIENNKLHHGYIFSGGDGIGKRTFAFRLARYLFAQNHKKHVEASLFGDELDEPLQGLDVDLPDGIKSQIELLAYPDLLYVSTDNPRFKPTGKTDTVTVSMVREVSKFLQLSSSHDGWRVILFGNFEKLTNSAQNAILKILEEPPEKVILLLITSMPGYILQTVKSRCQKVFFDPLKPEELQSLMSHHFDNAHIYEDKLKTYAHYTQGSFGNLVKLVIHEGFDVIESFTNHLNHFELNKIDAYFDKIKINQDPFHYEIILQVIEHWLAQKIKSDENPDKFFKLLDKYSTDIRNYAKFHLDKKYSLVNYLSEACV